MTMGKFLRTSPSEAEVRVKDIAARCARGYLASDRPERDVAFLLEIIHEYLNDEGYLPDVAVDADA